MWDNTFYTLKQTETLCQVMDKISHHTNTIPNNIYIYPYMYVCSLNAHNNIILEIKAKSNGMYGNLPNCKGLLLLVDDCNQWPFYHL